MNENEVFLGDFRPNTLAMGPGRRACLWVRGCPINCAGCVTAEFIPKGKSEHVVSVGTITDWISEAIDQHKITGVSFSGGEPFVQARALATIARFARTRNLSILSWSGFALEFLRSSRAPDGAIELLKELDVLIDGPFIARLANEDPYRGSLNQRIHLLTECYTDSDFINAEVEMIIDAKMGHLVTRGVLGYQKLNAVLDILGI